MKTLKKIFTSLLVGISILFFVQMPVQADTILESDITNYLSSRSGTVSVGVYDANTGKTYTYHPSTTYYTQSVVKISIMADVLYRGIPITSSENTLLTRMIEQSDNSSASTLWRQLGSDQSVQSFFKKIGMNNTVAGTGGWWGRTTTTVSDQLIIMKYFAYPNSLLTDSQRAYGLNLMRSVISEQRWGTNGGIPAGVSVALKNGWVTTGSYVNSVGYINGQGKNYVIVVLTKNNPSLNYGINTIEKISSLVWKQIAPNGWVYTSGKWYFYSNNKKVTGWLSNNGKWYFLDSTGVMKTGWIMDGDIWYYLNKDGSMKTGWLYYGRSWYFLDLSGAMKTGWIKSNSNWYYLQPTGVMKTGWLLSDGKWYYLQSNGDMLVGWKMINGKWYYFYASGEMATGWLNIEGKKYYLTDSGEMATGWFDIEGKKYYLTDSGEMAIGWLEIEGSKYYFDEDGQLVEIGSPEDSL